MQVGHYIQVKKTALAAVFREVAIRRKMAARRNFGVICAALGAMLVLPVSLAAWGQEYKDFATRTPIATGDTLILGILGGWEPWDNEKKNVRRLALKLRGMNLPGVHVETLENHRRYLALQLVKKALDRNQDEKLDEEECAAARIILYGHSFGGAAVVKLARELEQMGVPVLLTVQVDSIGRDDALIPPNVRRAANLFQRHAIFLSGEPEIRAQDPQKTQIVGNFKYDYSQRKVDTSKISIFRKVFTPAHSRMDYDPAVWSQVEGMILQELGSHSAVGIPAKSAP